MQQQLLIFELETIGHHPGYLRHLLRHWPDANTHLHFVVSPELGRRHEEVVNTRSKAGVTWYPISHDEWQWYEASKRSLVRRAWVEWQIYRQYAKKIQADQGLVMYLDRFQLPLALRFFFPCKTSGIFFRPKLHYRKFQKHRLTNKERLHAVREQSLWRSALRHPQLKTLFCLDPLAVEPLRALGGHTTVVHLPDPVELYPQSVAAVTLLRQTLEINRDRKVFLLFGLIDRRKGIYQVLAALQQLSIGQQRQITLLLVGQIAQADRDEVLAEIERHRQNSSVQIIVHNHYVSEEEIQSYFEIADVILALYQCHVGSSGILIRAAAAGKPVLASDFGLMGELVRQRRLGWTVNSTDPMVIANQISCLFGRPTEALFNRIEAAQFAAENSASAFVQSLWGDSRGEEIYL